MEAEQRIRYHYAFCCLAQMVCADLRTSHPCDIFELLVKAFELRLAEFEEHFPCVKKDLIDLMSEDSYHHLFKLLGQSILDALRHDFSVVSAYDCVNALISSNTGIALDASPEFIAKQWF